MYLIIFNQVNILYYILIINEYEEYFIQQEKLTWLINIKVNFYILLIKNKISPFYIILSQLFSSLIEINIKINILNDLKIYIILYLLIYYGF